MKIVKITLQTAIVANRAGNISSTELLMRISKATKPRVPLWGGGSPIEPEQGAQGRLTFSFPLMISCIVESKELRGPHAAHMHD